MLARCFSPSSGEQARNGATQLGSRAQTPFRDTFLACVIHSRARASYASLCSPSPLKFNGVLTVERRIGRTRA